MRLESARMDDKVSKPTPLRAAIAFVLVSLLPGLLYHYVQDVFRPGLAGGGQETATITYLAGVAPNFLGAVSLTGGINIVAREMVKSVPQGKVDLGAAALALLGLWAWEGLQLFMPYGAFDWHDLAWTVPGVLIGYFAASRILGRRTRS